MSEVIEEFIPVGGVLPDPEHNAGKNWVFLGAEDAWEEIEPMGDWGKFRSPPEKQATKYFDPYNCVSISLAADIEKHLNKMMIEDPSTRPLFDSLDLLHPDGYADISERFIAKGSGTIPGRGNSQYNVYEFVRINGFVGEKSWPSSSEMTEAEFYRDLSSAIRALGKKVLAAIGFNYKDIPEDNDALREGLKRSSTCVVVGGAILGKINGALLYRANGTPLYNHQLQNYKQDRNVNYFGEIIPVVHRIEDSYEPFLKDYAGNYPFKFAKIIKLTLKKKLSMTQVVRQVGQRNCYLYVPELDSYFGIEDSENLTGFNGVDGIVAGGDLVKPFAGGVYPNIPEVEIPNGKIVGRIRAELFN